MEGGRGEEDSIDTEALFYVLEEVPGRLSPYVPTPHYLRTLLAEILRRIANEHRLDVIYEPGCGAGDMAEYVEKIAKPRYYVGLEIDADLAKRARTRIELGDVVVGDLRSPPLRPRPLLVYAYLLPRPLDYLADTLEESSILVSLEYEPEDKTCLRLLGEEHIDTILTVHTLRIYRVECRRRLRRNEVKMSG